MIRRLLARLFLCGVMGAHDQWAECEGHEAGGPPEGHPLRPEPGDDAATVRRKFFEWTRLRCRRCGWGYPPVRT